MKKATAALLMLLALNCLGAFYPSYTETTNIATVISGAAATNAYNSLAPTNPVFSSTGSNYIFTESRFAIKTNANTFSGTQSFDSTAATNASALNVYATNVYAGLAKATNVTTTNLYSGAIYSGTIQSTNVTTTNLYASSVSSGAITNGFMVFLQSTNVTLPTNTPFIYIAVSTNVQGAFFVSSNVSVTSNIWVRK
jgi:hypothetical protein